MCWEVFGRYCLLGCMVRREVMFRMMGWVLSFDSVGLGVGDEMANRW